MTTSRSVIVAVLVGVLGVGFVAGVALQRTVGIGNALRALGVPIRSEARGDAPAAVTPFEVPADHRGRMMLFVLAGQSNMVGLAPLPPIQERETDPQLYVFGNDYRWRLAVEPVDDARGQVDPVSEDRLAGFGPSTSFGLASLARRPDAVIGLVPCAKSASAIGEWQRDLSDQSLYGSCLKRVRAAGPMGEVAGILFFQGEADALEQSQSPDTPLRPNDWADWFTNLVSDLRRDLQQPELPVVFAQLGTTESVEAFTAWETVKEQQASVRIPRVAMIRTEDLALLDGLHFTADSYRTIGRRFAEAYWGMVD